MARTGAFASSWWGEAWLDALERSARLDPNRLSRGRTYARHGAVGALDVAPGRVGARVQGQHGRYYEAEVEVRTIEGDAWGAIADAIAAKAAHSAALADGELDPAIVDDVRSVGLELLPGPGDIRPHCTCPDWAEPCKHAAAVCYAVAAELDRDPFVLFLLRGIGRDELTGLVAARRGGGSAPAPDRNAALGVVAADAWAGRSLAEAEAATMPVPTRLSGAASAPRRPTTPLPWDVSPARTGGVDPARVDELALDATVRAWRTLVDGVPTGLDGTPRGDLARRAVAAGPRELTPLAARSRLHTDTLAAWAEAWRLGGDPAVEVVADEDSWSIDQQRLADGRTELVSLGVARSSVALNYDSLGMPKGTKVVIGPDGRWYRLQATARARGLGDQWRLAAAPSDDITDVVDLAGLPAPKR